MAGPFVLALWLAAFAAGSLAALAIWGAGQPARGAVLGVFLLPMLPPEWLPFGVPAVGREAGLVALLAVFGVTLSLDRLDRVILRSLAACGAGPWRRFRMIVLPALALPFLYAALATIWRLPWLQWDAAAWLLVWSLIGAGRRQTA